MKNNNEKVLAAIEKFKKSSWGNLPTPGDLVYCGFKNAAQVRRVLRGLEVIGKVRRVGVSMSGGTTWDVVGGNEQ